MNTSANRPKTWGELRQSGYRAEPVKDEMRRNLVRMMGLGEELFPGILGYERTVIPQIQNALLARHTMILLGLRGQAKTRILRGLTRFLDPAMPVVRGCEIRDNPVAPVCKTCRGRLAAEGDRLEIDWIGPEERYQEKLATPDVTIADLLGDIDPIKAATRRLTYADEEVIHFGIVPRSNRGIFAINELPDLPPRIQVGLLNILEERDVQIRGFPVRMPLDILVVFSANPEDYTNRGNIITPLKDRIDSQIMTHYPGKMADAVKITDLEAWVARDGGSELCMPAFFKELVEEVAFQARKSELVDQRSGVSARVSIALREIVTSNMERRAIHCGDKKVTPRISDLYAALPALTGKIELVYEGEQEGLPIVARRIIGQAVKGLFVGKFPDVYRSAEAGRSKREARTREGHPPDRTVVQAGAPKEPRGESSPLEPGPYKRITDWFAKNGRVEISDITAYAEYRAALDQVPGLAEVAEKHARPQSAEETSLWMELVLEGLYQCSALSKTDLDCGAVYGDLLQSMFEQMQSEVRED